MGTRNFGATAAAPTAFQSVVEYSWDAASRLTQIVDKRCANPTSSLNCASPTDVRTITRAYDSLDRMVQEITPQGEVNYAYDKAGRRTSLVVKNGPASSQTPPPTANSAMVSAPCKMPPLSAATSKAE